MRPKYGNASADLRWFFDGSMEAALGMKAQDYQLSGCGGVVPEQVADRRAEAAMRSSRVRRRLDEIGVDHARVLRRAFQPAPAAWSSVGAGRWYELWLVAAGLVDEDLAAGAARVALLEHASPEAQALRARAQHVLDGALAAYVRSAPPRSEKVPDLPKVPVLKRPKEPARTWVPMAEGRAKPAKDKTSAEWWAAKRRED